MKEKEAIMPLRRFLAIAFTVLIAVVLAAFGLGWLWLTKDLPSVKQLVHQRQNAIMSNQQSTQVFADDGSTIILHNGRFVVTPVKLPEVAPVFTQALVATEDRRFYAHKGVDPISIGRALLRNAKSEGLKEGGSTLTQQLTRALFLSNERSLKRKIKEILLAYQLEQALSKEEILELYMNHVYFGQGAYGVAAASNVYFSKPPKQLTVLEASLLAGLPQAPSNYNPLVHPELATARRNEVLQNLGEVGLLSREEVQALSAKPLGLHPNLDRLSLQNRSPYFNQVVQQQVMDWFGLSEQEFWQNNLRIYTTLNLPSAEAAHAAIQRRSQQNGRTALKQQAMLMAMNVKTGAVLAYEGGKDFASSQFDRITQSPRSPGSTFKIFTYTEALAQSFSPYQTLIDEPVELGSWKPENYDKRHYGAMTLQQALNKSNNVIAVKLMDSLGVEPVIKLAQKLGITTPIEPNLASTLGASSVLMQDMVQAVGAIANHGTKVKPFYITKIVDANDQVLYEAKPEAEAVLDANVADAMVQMLQGVVQHGTGTAANYGDAIAGKTGTSDGFRDAWFVGFNPAVVSGVWVGNDDNTPMTNHISGGSMPTLIWHDFMQVASKQIKGEKGFVLKPKVASPVADLTEEPETNLDAETEAIPPSTEVPTDSNPDAPVRNEDLPTKPAVTDWSLAPKPPTGAPEESDDEADEDPAMLKQSLRQALQRNRSQVNQTLQEEPAPVPTP